MKDPSEKEYLIKGKVDFVDKSGAIYINGRALQPIVKKGDYIIVYRFQEKNSYDVSKK